MPHWQGHPPAVRRALRSGRPSQALALRAHRLAARPSHRLRTAHLALPAQATVPVAPVAHLLPKNRVTAQGIPRTRLAARVRPRACPQPVRLRAAPTPHAG